MPVSSLPGGLMSAIAALDKGQITSRDLVESCLVQIATSPNARAAYVLVDEHGARAQADAADRARRSGHCHSPLQGIPISIKDLFDVAGQITTAGSTVLATRPAALADADCLGGLRQAGMIFLGRTHMSEFAYSGLGLNAHWPDPASVWHAQGRRVPGGSSSGAGVSVAEGAAMAAIGTDTGGSCRIPAAFNGLVGFKPTASRVPAGGCFPLSPSLDSVGPIGRTVECCALLDRLLSGEARASAPTLRRRLLLPTNLVCEGMDADVATAFASAQGWLERAGFEIKRKHVGAFDMLPELTSEGGLVAIEAHGLHQELLATEADAYDPRTLNRIMKGANQPPQRKQALLALRQRFIAAMERELAGHDALVAPTSPIIPPLIESCMTEPAYSRQNLAVLRNPSLANLMDGCSLSLPIRACHAPVGFMLMSTARQDQVLLQLGLELEQLFNIAN